MVAALDPLESVSVRKRRVADFAGTKKALPEEAPILPTPMSGSKGPSLAGEVAQQWAQIQVAVRVRPVSEIEEKDSIIEVAGEGAIAVRKECATGGNEFLRSQRGRTEERFFDRVFGPAATQADVFEYSCKPQVATAVREGRSATVFVYGATGAGKTHTMFGEREDALQGLLPRALREVFSGLAELPISTSARLEAKVSFLDIYNENVRDLLQDGAAMCKVLEDARENVVKITNLREVVVQSAEEAMKQLRLGLQARKVEATAANARSSRSHAVFSVTLERVDSGGAGPGNAVFKRRGPESRRVYSRICLIDLAGSERANQTQNTGAALKDGAKINTSLLALANCIDALVSHRSANKERDASQTPRTGRKAPFRDSKLTLLLKSSLTSDCLVSMIANVHPGKEHFEDSNNTLEYAKRASVIKAPTLVRQPSARVSLPSRRPSLSPPSSPGGPDDDDDNLLVSEVVPSTSGRTTPRQAAAGSPKRRRTLDGERPGAVQRSRTVAGVPGEQRSGAASTSRARVADQARSASASLEHRARFADAAATQLPQQPPLHPEPAPPLPGSMPSTPTRISQCSEVAESCTESSTYGTAAGTEHESPCHFRMDTASSSCSSSDARTRSHGAEPCIEFSPMRTPPLRAPSPLDISARRARCLGAPAASPPGEGRQPREKLGACSPSASPSPVRGTLSLRRAGADDVAGTSPRPTRHAASPLVASRRKDCGGATSPMPSSERFSLGGLHSSPMGACSPNEDLLLKLVDLLQVEKAGLDAQLGAMRSDRDRLEADNARLRAANLEKDRQMALLLARPRRGGDRRAASPRLRRGASMAALGTTGIASRAAT